VPATEAMRQWCVQVIRALANLFGLSLAVLWAPGSLQAQCSVGWPLYKGCYNVTWQGCCTLKETQIGQITTVQWCENGFLCTAVCNPLVSMDSAWCGWNPDPGIYDCTYDTIPDPSGAHPYLCNIPCGDVTPEGCCEGQTLLKYCKNGSLNFIDCSRNQDVSFCGWDPVKQVYTCMKAPTVGPPEHPYTCGSKPVCQKQCAGKECGPDGCGGECGQCQAGQKCDATGLCKGCTPSCAGKQCGPDGCGGSCGDCPAGQSCNASGTACECVKQCAGKQCGPDGCGGECGQCAPGMDCGPAGICKLKPCEPDCAGKECGPDGCGGACGACQPPKTCVYGQCVAPGEDPGPPPDAALPETTAQDASKLGCPDGTVMRYGQCVPVPSQKTASSSGCTASTLGTFPLVLLLAFSGLALRRTG